MTGANPLTGTIGWIDGVPVPRAELDARLDALRRSPRADVLPAPGSREGRQLVRWTAHVLLTERLCAAEADRRGLSTEASAVVELDALGAVQLGSITTTAWRSHPAVSTLFRAAIAATAEREPRHPAAPVAPPSRHRLSLADGSTPEAARAAPFASIGWSTLDDLPAELADAARSAAVGETVGPLRSRGGWCLLRVDAIATERDGPTVGSADSTQLRPSGSQLRDFARLLDVLRARSMRVAPGFEHPGDPSQPDNTHRH